MHHHIMDVCRNHLAQEEFSSVDGMAVVKRPHHHLTLSF
jgi:hypothetical protein